MRTQRYDASASRIGWAARIVGMATITSLLAISRAASTVDGYDCYFNYLEFNDWPREMDTFYSEDVQGIAHDDTHWFITKGGGSAAGALFKIPVSQNLAAPAEFEVTSALTSGLFLQGVLYFKAMDSYLNPFDGRWYIVVGAEGPEKSGLAVFDAELQLKGFATLPDQGAVGWCAIDNNGKIYSADNAKSYLNRFSIDWAALASNGSVSFAHDGTIALLDQNGSPLIMRHYQGGDFTPEGDKLYVVTGFYDTGASPHGIHVFDATGAQTWRRVTKSEQVGLFAYTYDPNCSVVDGFQCEEPEGLTFWDLNDGRSPNIRGELHVLLLDNDSLNPFLPGLDDVSLKHYSEGIWVSQAGATEGGLSFGDPLFPLSTVGQGLELVPACMEVKIQPGTYPEDLIVTKQAKLVNANPAAGSVIIGE